MAETAKITAIKKRHAKKKHATNILPTFITKVVLDIITTILRKTNKQRLRFSWFEILVKDCCIIFFIFFYLLFICDPSNKLCRAAGLQGLQGCRAAGLQPCRGDLFSLKWVGCWGASGASGAWSASGAWGAKILLVIFLPFKNYIKTTSKVGRDLCLKQGCSDV